MCSCVEKWTGSDSIEPSTGKLLIGGCDFNGCGGCGFTERDGCGLQCHFRQCNLVMSWYRLSSNFFTNFEICTRQVFQLA